MNVFVLCTGRCGSVTFAKACAHITNFTSGHETRSARLGTDRLEYPGQHIEADNRLSWYLGRLERKYGDNAMYVHLTRDAEGTARSFSTRFNSSVSIIRAYRDGIAMSPEESPIEASRDYVETVTENIRSFLKNKTHTMAFHLETAAEEFPVFWQRIGAAGDLDAGVAEWSKRHNETRPSKPRLVQRMKAAVKAFRA